VIDDPIATSSTIQTFKSNIIYTDRNIKPNYLIEQMPRIVRMINFFKSIHRLNGRLVKLRLSNQCDGNINIRSRAWYTSKERCLEKSEFLVKPGDYEEICLIAPRISINMVVCMLFLIENDYTTLTECEQHLMLVWKTSASGKSHIWFELIENRKGAIDWSGVFLKEYYQRIGKRYLQKTKSAFTRTWTTSSTTFTVKTSHTHPNIIYLALINNNPALKLGNVPSLIVPHRWVYLCMLVYIKYTLWRDNNKLTFLYSRNMIDWNAAGNDAMSMHF
jgi:hypothetical protein